MKKKISIIIASLLVISCSFVGCNSTKGSQELKLTEKLPTFEKTKGIDFNAYAGPVDMSGGSVNTLTEEHMQKLAEAGFTSLTALYEGNNGAMASNVYDAITARAVEGTQPAAKKVLDLAEKYNIRYYVRDWVFHEMDRGLTANLSTEEEYIKGVEAMFNSDSIDYYKSPAFAGMYGMDEPSADLFDKISWQIKAFNKVMEEKQITGKEVFVNLYPSYASTAAFGGITYKQYIDQYFEKIAPLLGYVSFDTYPFKQDSFSGSSMKSATLSNLEFLANKCKENNAELRTYIQAGGEKEFGYRDFTSIGDFRLQIYLHLAFGSRSISYYRYGTKTKAGEESFALLNKNDGTYNWTYEAAKQVNNEVHAIEDVLCHYNYDGVLCINSLGDSFMSPDFRAVANKLSVDDIARIKSVESTKDAVLTTFKCEEGLDAYMLVNYNDPYFDYDNEVTITFQDTKAIMMYRFGKSYLIPLNEDGVYTFKLYPGEGRFIIPLK